jgi:NAD(P)-dependent dehydrogenase (short-subunit alcohol dehydrogenase family)
MEGYESGGHGDRRENGDCFPELSELIQQYAESSEERQAAAGTDAPGTVEELDVEGWDRTLSVNLRAPFLLSKATFPHMREAGGGTIVNVSSIAGKKGWANASAYCASKFGLTGLTEALADEGKAHGIRSITLYPGAMATNWGIFSPEERRQSGAKQGPATQVLPPERVADFIAWFAASPPEFVLTEGIVLPIEEGLP